MAEYVDYRPLIHTCSGEWNASFLLCEYEGRYRTFLYLQREGSNKPEFGHVTRTRNMDDGSLALTVSNFYENWKEYIVPHYLTTYTISAEKLIEMNGGQPLYLNCLDGSACHKYTIPQPAVTQSCVIL